MDTRIKTRWIASLHMTDARQGRHKLGYEDGSRCCLGLLCDLAVEDGVITKRLVDDDGDKRTWCYGIEGTDDESTTSLPAAVMTWAEIDTSSPFIAPETTAVVANDNERWTFPEIAQSIEYYC